MFRQWSNLTASVGNCTSVCFGPGGGTWQHPPSGCLPAHWDSGPAQLVFKLWRTEKSITWGLGNHFLISSTLGRKILFLGAGFLFVFCFFGGGWLGFLGAECAGFFMGGDEKHFDLSDRYYFTVGGINTVQILQSVFCKAAWNIFLTISKACEPHPFHAFKNPQTLKTGNTAVQKSQCTLATGRRENPTPRTSTPSRQEQHREPDISIVVPL